MVKPTKRLVDLISKASESDFGPAALAFLSSSAKIENFGAFFVADIARPAPELSFWSGRISDYWFQHYAHVILDDKAAQDHIVSQISRAADNGLHIERWHPGDDEKRKEIYAHNGIVERIAVSSKAGRTGLRSFYLRSAADGLISDTEYEDLCEALPVVHALIGARHQIVGTALRRNQAVAGATRLRDCNVPGFADLTAREADVCDLLLNAKSVAASALDLAVSEATIKTLRARAYRKLNVGSATELMALFVRSNGSA